MAENEPIRKQRIVTIHGVNSKGAWQEEVEQALGMLFDFDPIKYNFYRWFFGTELLFNPFVWPPLATVLIIAIIKGWVTGWCMITLCIVALVLIAHVTAYPYRAWAEKRVRRQFSEKLQSGSPPHLIAHSFGTYLSGRALRDLPWPRFSRIVLAGCVLHEHFPWITIRGGNDPSRFRSVRNEMAARDQVARLAARLESLIPGFGPAGYSGFKGPEEWVHNVESANSVCVGCERPGATALIHNIKCEELGHSDVFLGPAYAVFYWLPFLLGYDPAAYQQFLLLCFEIDEAAAQARKQEMKSKYQRLRKTSWGQFPKKTLDDEIKETVPPNHVPNDDELDQIATETLHFVVLGQHALRNEKTPERGKLIQCLAISVAIDLAWRKAFPSWQS